jgi:hypothetical protein
MILLCTEKLDSHSPFHRKMCILPQVRCHRPPIWPPALPLNLTYISTVSSKLSLGSPPCTNSLHSTIRVSYHIPSLGSFIKRIRPGPRVYFVFRNKLIFYGGGLIAPRPPPNWRTTSCRLSVAVYSIYSQLTSIAGGRSSVRNLSTRHAVGTGTHLTWIIYELNF